MIHGDVAGAELSETFLLGGVVTKGSISHSVLHQMGITESNDAFELILVEHTFCSEAVRFLFSDIELDRCEIGKSDFKGGINE